MARNRTRGPQPGVAREHPRPRTADASQEWRGTAPRTLSQKLRGATHHQHRRTPTWSGGEPDPATPHKPADLSQEWLSTTPRSTTSRPQPGVAGNGTKDSQPGVGRDDPPSPAAGPDQEWRGRADKHLSQEWRGAAPPPRSTTTAPKPAVAQDPPPRPTQQEGGDGAKRAHRGRRRGAQPQVLWGAPR